jgi:hypothetical protein
MATKKQPSTGKGLERRDHEHEHQPVLRDLALPDDGLEDVVGGAGKCPSWLCGAGGNHNEVLAVTE